MYKKNIDDLSIKLLDIIKSGVEGMTKIQIMHEVGIDHPQKLYNRLEKLIKAGYIDEDYNFIRGIDEVDVYIPFFGWAQCGNKGGAGRIDGYPIEKINIKEVDIGKIPPRKVKEYFLTRAKGKSM